MLANSSTIQARPQIGNTIKQDHPVPIGYGETISAPHMHAEALRLLEDHCPPGASVLDVGSGENGCQIVLCMRLLHDISVHTDLAVA